MSLKGTCVISTEAISREKKIAQIGERIRVRRRRLNRGRSLCFKRRRRRKRHRKSRKRRRWFKKLKWERYLQVKLLIFNKKIILFLILL